MQYVLIGIALFLTLMVVVRLLLSAPPATLAVIVKGAAAVGAALLVAFLAATGRLGPALGIAIMMAPLILRWRAISRRLKTAAGPTPGQTSTVRTTFLEAALDHDSGEMDARILDGPMSGRMLSELTREDLIHLFRTWQSIDPQSAALVETFLDRNHGPEWRHEAGTDAGAEEGEAGDSRGGRHRWRDGNRAMSLAEARATLGVTENATAKEIKEAHRRLMKQFHPDHGGTDYLAAKLNEAKEILLEYARD